MAWLRMMGAESVAYHRETIIGRGDDHPGQTLAYYASRGETPLAWGGRGAEGLGLIGNVTDAQYDAVYGPGGAVDPTTGERLVSAKRPGMELVIAAHKSVAELGVIDRAEDMHRIMDAERDATLEDLDALTARMGGRRGRAAVPTETSGLIYSTARHATTRAGDPGPHDHVLLANVVEMLDEKGGWKAADTALWREHVHAATMVGRVAAARVAVELGYAIVPDNGPSGRLGHWAIAGIPRAVIELHSKRSLDIAEAIEAKGFSTYQARQVAARETRRSKRHEAVEDLLPRWQAELDAAGHPAPELLASVERAAAEREPRQPWLGRLEVDRLVRENLAMDGPLSARKVFSRRDVIVAVAPALFGCDPKQLPVIVDRVIAHPDAVPLIGVPGARERAYATAHVLATEQAIAELVLTQAKRATAPTVPPAVVEASIAAREDRLGHPLTDAQVAATRGICTSGRGVELVIGVAGAGKTTTLAAVRDAFDVSGFDVIGTATSGQAARTLGTEADMASRTLASLLWRLDHGELELGARSVVVLDEAGMTDDPGMLRLLGAADALGAKVVMIGDHRQLGAVGPGGALEALVRRHDGGVHVLPDSVRQRDPEERAILAELRAGSVARAVEWYAAQGRVVSAPERLSALDAMVSAWADDVAAGQHTAMFAWRRANVAALNRLARERRAADGQLRGPEVQAPDGRRYAAGDWVVTLAPTAGGGVVTSERGVVAAVDPSTGTLSVRMQDGRLTRFSAEETAADRLDHGYAVTVHRSQGATVDTAHRFEDGGGRELAYVGMSRARGSSKVYVVADDREQALEDLCRDWSTERRQLWAIDSGTPSREPGDVERDRGVPAELRDALRAARLEAQRAAVLRAGPADPTRAIQETTAQLHRLTVRREETLEGRARTPGGVAARDLARARTQRAVAEQRASDRGADRVIKRGGRAAVRKWSAEELRAERTWAEVGLPEVAGLDAKIVRAKERLSELGDARQTRQAWLIAHPEVARRVAHLDQQLDRLRRTARDRQISRELPGRDRGHGLGR